MGIIIGLLIIAAFTAFQILAEKNYRKNMMRKLERNFGVQRENDGDLADRMEMIKILFDEEKKCIPENRHVDDITWNDLNMDDIFSRIDHTDSFAGEQYLYSRLHFITGNEKHFEKLESRAEIFDSDAQLRNEVRFSLSALGKNSSSYYIPQMIKTLEEKKMKFSWIPNLFLLLLLASAVAAVIMHDPSALFIFISVYIINIFVNTVLKMKYELNLHALFTMANVIGAAEKISENMNEKDSTVYKTAKKMSRISKIASYIELKNNICRNDALSAVFDYLAGAFMWEHICYDRLYREMIKYRDEYMDLYDYVGETDCSISILSYRKSIGQYCIPVISKEKEFELRQCFHPCIKNAVANDFRYTSHIILTGSNASGKSTFIKTVALNLILGQTIHTCTAEYAVIPECSVMTSMAVRDDVLSGESYYIREIKYLKRMTESVDGKRLMFLAVDEILKGTNTRERLAASKAVLKYFSERSCILIVATHDTELAEAFKESYENYHFTETITDGDISFDYKLHKGISRTTNAVRLLEMIKFPDEIIKNAADEK